MLNVLDLFSGIGGFAYASERIVGGFETVGFCEIDPFCQKVLKKNFPNVPIYTDIKELEQNAVRFRGYVDVICGGFPCQPWSNAGKKEGHEDQKGRDLWPEMASIIEQILPRFVIGENVRGFVNMPMGLPRSVNDLESIGYRVASFVIPSAYALGLPHRRERCWIIAELVADTKIKSFNESANDIKFSKQKQGKFRGRSSKEIVADTECMGWEERSEVRETFEGKRWSNNTCNGSVANGEKDNVANSNSKRLQRYRKHGELEGESSKNEFGEKSIQNTQTQIVANSNGIRQQRSWETIEPSNTKKDKIRETSRSDNASKRQGSGRKSFLRMGNLADGISQRLAYDYTIEPKDLPRVVKGEEKRADKLKALGNSIIPQCAAVFFQAIRDIVDEYD
tara:strand:+ start:746 stop:1927 length:1182 start_codon:yes stop_codon:yes gene_type:complete